MRKYLLIILFFISLHSFSQRMSISGNVQDTVSKIPLKNAVAMAVRIKDSVLVAFIRADDKGFFTLSNLPIDTLQVTISDSKFGDQTFYVFGSQDNREFDFGKIILPPKSQQLKEVVIYAFKDPVYYKGDTLVYAADSFKVKPNATVEDLLKKLPGIKVDAQGKITSQGKEVSQVLVDGDEFFGADPTMATKNLAANGVESVQVYEKKNDDAKEGEDETVQVMNLKLKDDAKKGYFGKASGGSDFQKFYEGDLFANKFKGSQKISVFSLASNTPNSNIGWGDMLKYGLDNEFNSQTNDDGSQEWYNENANQNKGIPQTLKSGVYYNDKIGKKTKFGFNYTYSNNQLNALSSSRSQHFLNDTAYITKDSSRNFQKNETHSINFKITQTIDSLTELIIEPKFNLSNATQNNFQLSRFLTTNDVLTHQTDIANTNKAKGYDINTSVRLNRKFKNRDRSLKLYYNFSANNNKSDGFLKSFNTFYSSAIQNDSINQEKINSGNSQLNNATITYAEPLTKKIRLEFEYNFNYNKSKQNKKTQNFFNGEYSVNDSTHTNNFENTKITNRLGLKFIYETKKQSFNVGAKLRNVSISNDNLVSGTSVKQSVNNVLPFLGYAYRFNQNTRLNFRYTTTSSQPSVNQLQPIPDNSNPNQVKLGNPNLLPTFSNNFNVNFNTYKPVSGKYMWAGGNASVVNNAFANSIIYDSLGRTISQAVNVNGNSNASGYAGFSLPFFSKMLQVDMNANCNYNNYTSFINAQKNINKNLNTNAEIGITIQLDTIDFHVGYSYDYNVPSSSLNNSSNKPYSTQTFDASMSVKLPFKFLIESDAKYYINSNRAPGYNINYFLWNATISKLFLKNENLILAISGNDILNQNISTTRTIQDNVITDNKTNIISRYFLLKLTYKFNSTHTKDNEDEMW
jgi:hypothetical protein